ncbi:extracellular solute-binding protein [Thermococcus paralvinellae]|uniref:Multiple sugar-binding transport solute-binding protein n=1 Tax=Thermococcus paralvinellae TaxID=582419 RepID=W0I1M9_9EURY|nr:extracellular solute-binding protein [Thermococcus paralvinellae]AHF79926.1 multiple sugar-binding transport solute-binding protein [Thermococcus paralvinellae]
MIKVKYEIYPWKGYYDKIKAAVAAGKGPDVAELGLPNNFAIEGVLLPLDDFIKKEGDAFVKDFYEGPWKAGINPIDGKQYNIPWFTAVRIPFWNKDLMDKYGIKEVPKTWDEFLKVCELIKEKSGGQEYCFAFGGQWSSYQLPWVWQAGGDLVSPDQRKATIDTPEWKKAIGLLKSFIDKGYAPKACPTWKGLQVEGLFKSGKVLMVYDGPWFIGDLQENTKINFIVSEPLEGPAGKYVFAGADSLVIFKNTKHPEEAWLFIKYMVSPEVQEKWCKVSRFFPSRYSVKNPFGDDPYMKIFAESAKYGKMYPPVASFAGVWGKVKPELEAYYLGKKSLDEALKKAQEEAQKAVDKWWTEKAKK